MEEQNAATVPASKDAPFTVTLALEFIFGHKNSDIAIRAQVNYSAAASWRKRYKANGLSTDLSEKIILAFGFSKTEEHRYTLAQKPISNN